MISQTFIIRSLLQLYIVHFTQKKQNARKKLRQIFFFFSSLFYTVTVPLSLCRIAMVDGLMFTEWQRHKFRSKVTFTGVRQDRRRRSWKSKPERVLEPLRFARVSHTPCRGHGSSCLRRRRPLTSDLYLYPPPGRAKVALAFVYIFNVSAVDLSLVVAGCVCKHVLESVGFSQEKAHLLIAPVDCGKVLQQHEKTLKREQVK